MDIKEYWDREEVQSLEDKHLLNAEISLIKERIPIGAKVLDAGCGEGEGTLAYAAIADIIHAVDFSETRLRKASERLKDCHNVTLKRVDFLGDYHLDSDYDIVITQRFLINLTTWETQSKVILDLMSMLKLGGKLLMLEGSSDGVECLNELRVLLGLKPILVRWHNVFFDDSKLIGFMQEHDYPLVDKQGLGGYFLLTRGVKPYFDREPQWNCEFNHIAAMQKLLDAPQFSRQKLWVFEK